MAYQAPITIDGETRDYIVVSHYNTQLRQPVSDRDVVMIPHEREVEEEIFVDENINGVVERVKKTVKRTRTMMEAQETITNSIANVETVVWHVWPSREARLHAVQMAIESGRLISLPSHWAFRTERRLGPSDTPVSTVDEAYTVHGPLLAEQIGAAVEWR